MESTVRVRSDNSGPRPQRSDARRNIVAVPEAAKTVFGTTLAKHRNQLLAPIPTPDWRKRLKHRLGKTKSWLCQLMC